jgi:predicted alpha/beta hydrolase family esterase
MMPDSDEAMSTLIVPGLGGSGAEHRQSRRQR